MRGIVMYQALGLKFWISFALYVGVQAAVFAGWTQQWAILRSDWVSARNIFLIIDAIVLLLLVSPVWRYVWRKIPAMEKWVYPDLNGVYDVTIRTNWPIQTRMLAAAKGEGEPFDPVTLKGDNSELGGIRLLGKI